MVAGVARRGLSYVPYSAGIILLTERGRTDTIHQTYANTMGGYPMKTKLTKKERENRITRSVTLDREIWENGGRVLASVGLSRSRFIELMFREIVRSEKVSFAEITGELFEAVAESAVQKALHKHSKR